MFSIDFDWLVLYNTSQDCSSLRIVTSMDELKAFLYLFILLFLPPITSSFLRSKYATSSDSAERHSLENPQSITFPAIFSSPMSPKGSELYNFTAQLDVWEATDGRVFYLVTDDETLAEYNLLIPEIMFENERTGALHVLPKLSRSIYYSAKNDYPTISNSFSCFRSLEGSYQTITALETQYPSLVEVVNIGPSYLKSIGKGGHDIELLKITNKNSNVVDKSHLFVICALHVRELATAEACARFAENMLSDYGSDADISWILDYTEIHVVLQSNPDGRADDYA